MCSVVASNGVVRGGAPTCPPVLEEGRKHVSAAQLMEKAHIKWVKSLFRPDLTGPFPPQIISVTGFVDNDRDDLKLMAYLAGAKYTGYLCRSNTVLICRE